MPWRWRPCSTARSSSRSCGVGRTDGGWAALQHHRSPALRLLPCRSARRRLPPCFPPPPPAPKKRIQHALNSAPLQLAACLLPARRWEPHAGTIPGARTKLPFLCPADHVLDLEGGLNGTFDAEVYGPDIPFRWAGSGPLTPAPRPPAAAVSAAPACRRPAAPMRLPTPAVAWGWKCALPRVARPPVAGRECALLGSAHAFAIAGCCLTWLLPSIARPPAGSIPSWRTHGCPTACGPATHASRWGPQGVGWGWGWGVGGHGCPTARRPATLPSTCGRAGGEGCLRQRGSPCPLPRPALPRAESWHAPPALPPLCRCAR
jgi:hypothetical protein